MLQDFKRLPKPLQKQTFLRLKLSVMFFILLVVLIIVSGDIYLWIPCAGASLFFAAAAILMFQQAILNKYVVINGVCNAVGQTAIKRRVKYFILHTAIGQIKVIPRSRPSKIQTGAEVRLYVTKNTPIYEDNGVQILYTYMAMDVN